VMASIVTTMGATTSVGMLASTSRQFWSFARDRGIPGWRVWSQVCGLLNMCSLLPQCTPN
jgi:amino acid transporter